MNYNLFKDLKHCVDLLNCINNNQLNENNDSNFEWKHQSKENSCQPLPINIESSTPLPFFNSTLNSPRPGITQKLNSIRDFSLNNNEFKNASHHSQNLGPSSLQSNAGEISSLINSTIQEKSPKNINKINEISVEKKNKSMIFLLEINRENYENALNPKQQILKYANQLGNALKIKENETLSLTQINPCCLKILKNNCCKEKLKKNKTEDRIEEEEQRVIVVWFIISLNLLIKFRPNQI
jgi:hypothetical protein